MCDFIKRVVKVTNDKQQQEPEKQKRHRAPLS